MILYLQGFMGTGKSTIGKNLARVLAMEWIDLDDYLVSKAGMSIPDLFTLHGETYFRDLEETCLLEVSKRDNCLVTTGGGVVIRTANREIMKSTGIRVTLTASLDCIWERVQNDRGRPLLNSVDPMADLKRLFEERRALYQDCDFEVDTTGGNIEEVIQSIKVRLSTEPTACYFPN